LIGGGQARWSTDELYTEPSTVVIDVWAKPGTDVSPALMRELSRAKEVHESFGKTEWALSKASKLSRVTLTLTLTLTLNLNPKARSSRVRSALKFGESEENLSAAQRLLGEAQNRLEKLQALTRP